MSSRKVLTLLDGLPGDCWYKISVHEFLESWEDEQERTYASDVGSLIYAGLTGQLVEGLSDD